MGRWNNGFGPKCIGNIDVGGVNWSRYGITDFLNGIKVSLEDLEYTNEHGYVKGVSNIFTKHCTSICSLINICESFSKAYPIHSHASNKFFK